MPFPYVWTVNNPFFFSLTILIILFLEMTMCQSIILIYIVSVHNKFTCDEKMCTWVKFLMVSCCLYTETEMCQFKPLLANQSVWPSRYFLGDIFIAQSDVISSCPSFNPPTKSSLLSSWFLDFLIWQCVSSSFWYFQMLSQPIDEIIF